MELNEVLTKAVNSNATDIHLKIGRYPIFRINRKLVNIEEFGKITEQDVVNFINQVVKSEVKKAELIKKGELDISYSIPKVSRFRVNIYRQRGTYAFAFRILKTKIPSFEELNLPPKLSEIALERRGLVLVTGPTGTGKSTTLAAMIDYRNQNMEDVIITIEDPIEYVFRDKKSYIVQREIGLDTSTFSTALRAALREDPDVIMVGEMRDIETIETALRAAETGHLVFSTLHTQDAKETINRIIDMFPLEAKNHIRLMLASTLKAIISQRLIPRADREGIVPAVEILINTGAVFDAIIDPDKFEQITDLMEKGKTEYGMQTFDMAILDLYNKGWISYKDALAYATNPSDLDLKIKGVSSGEYDTGLYGFDGNV
ncbi:type IV pilus twitching motility protein PilT [Persephonella sp. KM09-Lau-8]|uniref:type IV pilus twitching motility protein PilT n=1 Tax=Persephonella sp. KM09-Lau-8 TaxID=1158345 RepID=UPI000495BC61|nr:type IV pilus twitching motility protein PilT [Persephonella sp. KM09-Lau-8]